MTRDINITIVNTLPNDIIYVSNDLSHGQMRSNYPVSTIYGTNSSSHNSNGQMAVEMGKTTGSSYGVTGNVTYQLPNNQGLLVLMFNNPYSQQGSGYNGNCWLFSAITTIPADSTTTYYAVVSGLPVSVDPPYAEDTMDATVTVYAV